MTPKPKSQKKQAMGKRKPPVKFVVRERRFVGGPEDAWRLPYVQFRLLGFDKREAMERAMRVQESLSEKDNAGDK
jgi:hypothetical protein